MHRERKICICPEEGASEYALSRSGKIARDFDLPLLVNGLEKLDPETEFLIMVSKQGIYLKPVNEMVPLLGSKPIYPDWSSKDVFSAAGRKASQPLIKAIRGSKKTLHRGIILDGTAGWGDDTWIMAAFGFSLISMERNKIVYLLLRDAYARAGMRFPRTSSRIRLLHMDTLDCLQSLCVGSEYKNCLFPCPDVVYLDPMFPGSDKRKTAEKKETRSLRLLEGETQCDSERDEQLLELSLHTAGKKVVVKRPRNGRKYAEKVAAPVHQVFGKGIRFDVYIK